MVDVQGLPPEDTCYMCYHDYESNSVYMRAGLDVPGADGSCDSGHVTSHTLQTGSDISDQGKRAGNELSTDCACPGINSGRIRGQTVPLGREVIEGGDQIYRLHHTASKQAPSKIQLPSVSVNAELKYS